jgi:hypothetical protein
MPTRADIEAAAPRCQARRQEWQTRPNFGLRGGTLRHPVEFLCLKRMRYRTGNNPWVCECGSTESGEVLGARAAAFEVVAEAA